MHRQIRTVRVLMLSFFILIMLHFFFPARAHAAFPIGSGLSPTPETMPQVPIDGGIYENITRVQIATTTVEEKKLNIYAYQVRWFIDEAPTDTGGIPLFATKTMLGYTIWRASIANPPPGNHSFAFRIFWVEIEKPEVLPQRQVATWTKDFSGTFIVTYPTMPVGFGACVSDTAWPRFGSYFNTHHLDVLADYNVSVVRIYLNWWAWTNDDTRNVLNVPYRQYIATLCDETQARGMTVWISLARSEANGDFPWELKRDIIRNTDGLGDAWRNWGVDVIQTCHPDAIDTMCETTGVVTFQELYDFNVATITAFRHEAPHIHIFVYGGCWKQSGSGGRPLRVWEVMPLPFDGLTYTLHTYYKDSSSRAWCLAYASGDFAEGKRLLYEYLDAQFGSLYPNVWLGEFGGYRKEYDRYANWDVAAQGFYDYCRDKGIGCTQYACGKSTYPLFDVKTHTDLNDSGQLLAQNTASAGN